MCVYIESIHRFSGAKTELVHFHTKKANKNQTITKCICDDKMNEGTSIEWSNLMRYRS